MYFECVQTIVGGKAKQDDPHKIFKTDCGPPPCWDRHQPDREGSGGWARGAAIYGTPMKSYNHSLIRRSTHERERNRGSRPLEHENFSHVTQAIRLLGQDLKKEKRTKAGATLGRADSKPLWPEVAKRVPQRTVRNTTRAGVPRCCPPLSRVVPQASETSPLKARTGVASVDADFHASSYGHTSYAPVPACRECSGRRRTALR